jgi:lipoprotein-anchoring transpeptidase ErfK/SrfK
LFANQSEPELPALPSPIPPFDPANRPDFSDFPKPPQLLPANPDAKPIPVPSRVAQAVQGELPPWESSPESPKDFSPKSPIQLLADETNKPKPAPLPPEMAAVADKIKQIDEWMAGGEPQDELSAHKELSTMYWEHPEWREALRSRIEKTAHSIYFAPQPHYMTAYTMQPGDQLSKVGKLYHVPWEYLARLNQVDPRKVRAGQKLKVIKGPFAAVVDLHLFELTIQHHGFFVKRYKVGIGKDGTSPIGEFTIKNKLVNPTYYGPDGNVIAADDPNNPLGEYWIDIGDSYGIHGTIDPASIGKAESKGCVRMLNDDAAEVYGFLGLGAKVIIRR